MKNILNEIDSEFSEKFKLDQTEDSAQLIRKVLSEINRFIYCKSDLLRDEKCNTGYGEEDYFSEYHKFWEENHSAILGLEINEEKCREVAMLLESKYRPFSPSSIMDVQGLEPEHLANIRLLTAIQDFGFGLKADYYDLGRKKPYLFEPKNLLDNRKYRDELLRELGVADYQRDKREEWLNRCADMLIKTFHGTAYHFGESFNYDALKIREMLEKANIGMSAKKADMFLRDMQDFGVWELVNFEEVNVPSDINTMKIALKTGIITSRIPLLSSFLDIFCYQYGEVDSIVSKAWKRVWEIWKEIPDNHAVSSPAYIDFLIYNMGRRRCCRPSIRHCEEPCTEKQQRKCVLNKLVFTDCDGYCVFSDICSEETKILNNPKSISIYGR